MQAEVSFSCAAVGGVTKCWGLNTYGQLGDGSATDRATPTAVDASLGGTSVLLTTGVGSHTCTVLDSGVTTCWGSNGYGQLGDGSTTNRYAPIVVDASLGGTPVLLAAGNLHTCAVLDSGVTKCWGYNGYGQLGDGSTTNRYTPTIVHSSLGGTPVLLAAGMYYTCAVLDSGVTKCWGSNNYGQLGDGSTTNRYTPTIVHSSLGGTPVLLAAGQYHTCAVLDSGKTKCWGYNTQGQLGDASVTTRHIPTTVDASLGGTPALLAVGYLHTCAVLDSGATKCWGYNGYGQLGDGSSTDRTTPTTVHTDLGGTPVLLAAGDYHSCAVLDSAAIRCWGYNGYGQVGDGSTMDSTTPVSVAWA